MGVSQSRVAAPLVETRKPWSWPRWITRAAPTFTPSKRRIGMEFSHVPASDEF